MPFISKLLNKSIILLINLSHTLSFSLSHTHVPKHTPFYTWYIFSCNFCMEGLWLNPNLIFQICSASIFMQPLRQEMILRWGLIWMEDIDSGQMCPYGWRKLRHKCATALQLMWSWDSWTGEQGEATQHFSQYKHKNMIVWEKKAENLDFKCRSLQKFSMGHFQEQLSYCQCFANKESDCNHVHLLIVGDSNRSKCRTLSDYTAAQHGCNQELRPAQSSQTQQIPACRGLLWWQLPDGACVLFSLISGCFYVSDLDQTRCPRVSCECEYWKDERFNDVVKCAVCRLRAIPLCLSVVALRQRCKHFYSGTLSFVRMRQNLSLKGRLVILGVVALEPRFLACVGRAKNELRSWFCRYCPLFYPKSEIYREDTHEVEPCCERQHCCWPQPRLTAEAEKPADWTSPPLL